MPANNGIVEIHGRQYETVALRVKKFRESYPKYTLRSKIVRLDEDMVVIEAEILDEIGRQISNGHAQEFRQSSQINKTSYVENCETSAIGRALATFGLGGTEFATADEVAHAISGKAQPRTGANGAGACKDEFAALSADAQAELEDLAYRLRVLLKKGDMKGAYDEIEAHQMMHHDDGSMHQENRMALSSRLESNERAALKKEGERRKKPSMDEKAAA